MDCFLCIAKQEWLSLELSQKPEFSGNRNFFWRRQATTNLCNLFCLSEPAFCFNLKLYRNDIGEYETWQVNMIGSLAKF